MNKFIFTGNLGKDCQIQATQAGKTICKFSVAVKSGFGDHQKTNWVMCVLFGKRAEGQLPQYLVKGAQVAISGEMTLDEWQDQQGQTQKMLKVVVDDLDLIGSRPQLAQQPQYAPQPQQAAPAQGQPMAQPQYAPQHQQPPQGQPMGAHQTQPQQQPMQPAQDFGSFDGIPFMRLQNESVL